MKKGSLIEHKEVAIICEENGPINLSHNDLLTTPKANTIIKHVVHVVIAKSTLTCTNCGKIGHSLETCHNNKKRYQLYQPPWLNLQYL
jgi:hypothetical protein